MWLLSVSNPGLILGGEGKAEMKSSRSWWTLALLRWQKQSKWCYNFTRFHRLKTLLQSVWGQTNHETLIPQDKENSCIPTAKPMSTPALSWLEEGPSPFSKFLLEQDGFCVPLTTPPHATQLQLGLNKSYGNRCNLNNKATFALLQGNYLSLHFRYRSYHLATCFYPTHYSHWFFSLNFTYFT